MKYKFKYISVLIFGYLILFCSCVKKDYFGKSGFNEIRYFTMPLQAGNTQIIQDSLLIRVMVSPTADLTKLFADSIGLSSYATVSPVAGVIQDFSKPVIYTVTAEDGTNAAYSVIVTRESSTPQLENGSLDDWYTPPGKNYQEPGLNDATIWATGNAGVVTLGAANVKPVTVSGTDLAAEMVTKDLGALAQLVGQRMAAGTIFTGKFELDIANPLNSTKFGIPFTGRPVSFTFSYTYAPGSPYRNGQGQILTKNDSCDIYLLLENRDNNQVKRIATGWFRNTDKVDTYKEITIPLTYGKIPPGSPVYMYPVNGIFGTGSEPVTHISFVAASSAYGAFFEGGVNTRLVVNNVRLNY
ncbi:MAG: PCMD domain-containing protein [Chitinophagaceae bacterium]